MICSPPSPAPTISSGVAPSSSRLVCFCWYKRQIERTATVPAIATAAVRAGTERGAPGMNHTKFTTDMTKPVNSTVAANAVTSSKLP